MSKQYKIWLKLNQRYFNMQLKKPRFVKFKGDGSEIEAAQKPCYGAYDRGVIYLHRKLKGRDLVGTIAHEMIHQFQEQILKINLDKLSNKAAHGVTFEPHANVMLKDGIKIHD